MRRSIVISFLSCIIINATAQSGGVEQYYYTRTATVDAVMTPIAHITSSKNWYGEARYNFDELNTFSLYAGKRFSKAGILSWEATPMIGALMGQMKGGSVGMNGGIELEKIFFSTQSQYTFSLENSTDKFFYTWSELGYAATSWLYAGLALQQTNVYRENVKIEPGCMIGFSIKNWTIPLYAFNNSDRERYYVLGVNWQWDNKKKKNRTQQFVTAQPNEYKYE